MSQAKRSAHLNNLPCNWGASQNEEWLEKYHAACSRQWTSCGSASSDLRWLWPAAALRFRGFLTLPNLFLFLDTTCALDRAWGCPGKNKVIKYIKKQPSHAQTHFCKQHSNTHHATHSHLKLPHQIPAIAGVEILEIFFWSKPSVRSQFADLRVKAYRRMLTHAGNRLWANGKFLHLAQRSDWTEKN